MPTLDNGIANGVYKDDVIYLALDSEDKIMSVFSHEITHHFEVTAPQTYAVYKAAVLEILEKEANISANEQIDNTIKLYSENGINLTYDEAVSELIADYTERLITDSDKIWEFVEGAENINYEQKANILKRLLSAIKNFVNRINTAIGNQSGINIGSELKQVQNTADILERMIAESSKNAENQVDMVSSNKQSIKNVDKQNTHNIAENSSANEDVSNIDADVIEGDKVVPYTDKEQRNWKNSNSIIVYENDKQFESFIKEVLENKNIHKKIYFGKIPDLTAQIVLKKTGVDVKGHNIALKGYEIRKILLNSHGEIAQETARGQEPITAKDLKNIPSIVANPDDVTLSNKEYEGKPALLFEKNIDGKNYIVAYVSRKHHDVAIQTMYKKRSLATAENAKALSSTSETTSSTASNNIISQNNNIVNSSIRKEDGLNNTKYNLKKDIFGVSADINEEFSNQIDMWLSGNLKSSEQLKLGQTPEVLRQLGANNFPVLMSQDVLTKITGEKHNISLDEIKRIPNAIANPIMIFKSATVPNSFVILTELVDKSGNDVVVAMHLNRKSGFNFINRIASVYGKNNISGFINKQVEQGNLKYINKKKSQDWLRSRGLRLPKLNTILDSSNNILQKEDIVNRYNMQNSKNNSDIRYSIKRGKDNADTSLDNSIKLPYNEYKQLREYVMMKNNSRGRISTVDCKEIGNNFYIWRNNSKTDFEVAASIPIDGNEDRIDFIRGEIDDANRNGKGILNTIEVINQRYRKGNRSSTVNQDRISNVGNDRLSEGKSTRRKTDADGRGNLGESDRNTSKDSERYSIKLGGNLIDLVQEYGKIPKGEKAARDVSFPKQISDKQYVSQYARTAAEAGTVPNNMVSEYEKAVLDGRLTYERISDKSAIEYAENAIKRYGFEEVLARWNALVDSGHSLNKKDLALGDLLHVELAKHGDTNNAMKVFVDLTVERTRSAQNVQSSRLLKMLSADGQLYYIEKTVLALNEELKEKLGDKYKDIELDGKLLKQFLEARTDERRNEIYDKICLNIAEQIPTTGFDKWNAWRYLAMLGNPRTHIRNIVGNAVFYPAVRIKGYIAAGLERTFLPKEKRTTSINKTKESKAYAAKDFLEIKKELQGVNAKYAITDDIDSKRQIFKVKALEYLRKTNSALLEIEDLFFLKRYYEDAFARFMTARGITARFLDSGTSEASKALSEIRKKAIQEAQEATYRDANTAAEALSKFQHNTQKSNKKIIRAAGIAVEGVLPFKKTPLNIVKRGIEYSPIGLTNGIWNVCTGVKKGKITAAEAINKIAKGITGTGLCMLGYVLAHFGLLSGSDDEDEKKRKFDGLVGKQSYALCFGGKSYTIDWMAPINLPLFVGVELRRTTENEEWSFAQVINAISTISSPILELSCLSGASNVVEATQYNDTNVAMAIVWEIATSYLTQAIPTAFGQVARAIDSNKRNVYYKNKGSKIPADIQVLFGKIAAKTPGLGKLLLEPKIDLWGREETYGDTTERILENFVSPGYYSKEEYTEVDNEIDRLYKETGDNAVLPIAMGKDITISEQKYNLNVHDYTEAAKLRGRKSFELVKELISSSKYKKMSDVEKVKAIRDCYTDALDYVKSEMAGELDK